MIVVDWVAISWVIVGCCRLGGEKGEEVVEEVGGRL